MSLYLNESRPRTHFKRLLGNANQLIITALVGLEGVERGLITQVPADLHAAWSPKDPAKSARRTRRLILDMALVRAVDALDLYINMARRKPHLIQDATLQGEIDRANRSVLTKFKAVAKFYTLDTRLAALMNVMIAWRNRGVHSEADNEVSKDDWGVMESHSAWFETEFRGLLTERLFKDFDDKSPPTFREVASFLHATQVTVQNLETLILKRFAPESFLRELIWANINDDADDKVELKAHRKHRIAGIWGRDQSQREGAVRSFLTNLGLSPIKTARTVFEFESGLITRLGEMTSTEAYLFVTGATP